MAAKWKVERLPQFEKAIEQLVQQHLELKDESHHLALVYLPQRDGRRIDDEIFLFEVIGGIADNWAPSEEFLETTFVAAPGLPTGFDQPLHLILMSQRDVEKAIEEGWALALEIADALHRGDYKVLHQDAIGGRILRQIGAAPRPRKRAARG